MEAQRGPLAGIPLLEDLLPLDGKKVLVRADLNVPLTPGADGGWVLEDDYRIRAAVPTMEWLVTHGARVTVCSHLGRPKVHEDRRFDIGPVRARLTQLVGDVEVLQNLRFHPGEEANDPAFVARLIDGFDAYVNDAFACCHRLHASIVGPPTRLPSAAGRLLAREVAMLGRLLTQPARPYVVVVGGAKVRDKLDMLAALLERADQLLVGGAMAFTFLCAQGHRIGSSPLDPEGIGPCRTLLEKYGDRLVLPRDTIGLAPSGHAGDGAVGDGSTAACGVDLPDGWTGADIGPDTVRHFSESISTAGSIFWNGPLGVFEDPRFAGGTRAIAEAIASSSAFSVVGGGDTVAALDEFDLAGQVTFVSTGGGASLDLLEHGDLPGLVALRAAPNARAGH